MRNTFLEFVGSPAGDTRCKKCKLHKYVILSEHDVGFNVLHSYAHITNGNNWPQIGMNQGLHRWGAGLAEVRAPECYRNYKKIGGK